MTMRVCAVDHDGARQACTTAECELKANDEDKLLKEMEKMILHGRVTHVIVCIFCSHCFESNKLSTVHQLFHQMGRDSVLSEH